MSSYASNKQILFWEIAGVCFIILVGGPLHEAFAQSGNWRPLALIVPVNESIWEHQKMNFWPALLFAGFQFVLIGRRIPNYWAGKLTGLVVTPVLAVPAYLIYIEIERASAEFSPNFIGSTLLSILCVCIGQAACYRVLTGGPVSALFRRITPAAYLLLIVAFSTFSYFPPKLFLFEQQHHYEPIGQYGIDVDPEVGPHPWDEPDK